MKKLAIHSVPRSGSSWLGEIINSSENVNYAFQPLFSYTFKSALNENSTLEDINDFYKNISVSEDDFITQKPGRELGRKPKFKKKKITLLAYKEVRYHYVIENLIKKDSKQKVIGLIRNPLAVLSSWLNAPREFRVDLGWDFANEWEHARLKNEGKDEEYFGYSKWKEAALLYKRLSKEFPDNFLLVNYENLLSNTSEEVKKIFHFLKLDMTEQTESFINLSGENQVNDTYSVFKNKNGVDDSWKTNIPENIVQKVLLDCKKSGLSEFINQLDMK